MSVAERRDALWLDAFPGGLSNEPLARHSQFGVGGPARWFLKVTDAASLTGVMRRCAQTGVTVTVLGAGSNALNACAALILATFAGAQLDSAVAACADFRGPARRFEILGDAAGVTVVDDYAHHPTEVEAGIAAARQRYGSRRLIAIHTPHTYSRTWTLLEDYRRSFSDADVAVLGPIEEARERGQPVTVTSHDVAKRARPAGEVHVVDSSEDAIRLLCDLARPGDVMLVLSLGGFDKLAPRLRDALGTLRVGG